MENQDKLFSQFKNAAEKSDAKDFPNSDKIWSRVEDKLDQKVLKKQTKVWKEIAIAASILLVGTLVFITLQPTEINTTPSNSVVNTDTLKSKSVIEDSKNNSLVFTDTVSKNEAEKQLQEQIKNQPQVAVADEVVQEATLSSKDTLLESKTYLKAVEKADNNWFKQHNFESRSVKQVVVETDEIKTNQASAKSAKKAKKEDPLMVLDGNVTDRDLYKMSDDEVESIVELPEPLYIINSVYYTEKELFGPDPTSPYAPLNKQKIETISILQPEKAITIYGKKGEKGIVIITTKDGKPLAKKKE